MVGKVFILIFKKDKGFLVDDIPMSFEQLDLPAIGKTFKDPAYWKIKVLAFKEDKFELFCKVLDYKVGDIEFSAEQISYSHFLSNISSIKFKALNTAGMLSSMAGDKKPSFLYPKPFAPASVVEDEPKDKSDKNFSISERFFVPLKNVRFKFGGVEVDRHFRQINKTVRFTIPNYDIREEFDAVKNYFSNVLKTKSIEVEVEVEIEEDEIVSQKAASPEISKINHALIESVKFEFVRSTFKKKIDLEVNQSLFTMDEYLDNFGDKAYGANYYSDEKELFEDILSITNAKHYRNLRFLSSLHCSRVMKLRFIHKPFSFIFLIEGERKYHLIWETLDSEEATYCWSCGKSKSELKLLVAKIEHTIQAIKLDGKSAYINSSDYEAVRIFHDYSNLSDGFVKWKGELESHLL